MEVTRNYKYRLYPTKEQEAILNQWLGNTRFFWNFIVSANKQWKKQTGKYIPANNFSKYIPLIKDMFPFLKSNPALTYIWVLRFYKKALSDGLNPKLKNKGTPKFKFKYNKDSFSFHQGYKINKNSITIPKLKYIKMIKDRPIKGKTGKVTIYKEVNKWYCVITCKNIYIEEPKKVGSNIIGIDVGLKHFAVCSDNTIIDMPDFISRIERSYTKLDKQISKMRVINKRDDKKNGSNYKKLILKRQKKHEKIKLARKHFLDEISKKLVLKYDGIVIEDLNIKGMVRNKKLAKSINSKGWGMFKEMLKYKAEEYGKHFIKVDRFFPSSKLCSNCGNKQEMPLHKRIYKCNICGIKIDRDLNAALNIKSEGLKKLEATVMQPGCNASGLGEALAEETSTAFVKLTRMNEEKEIVKEHNIATDYRLY